jgi:hypothetical protein
MALVGNLVLDRRKRILGGLKTYLRATDHTSSNIISRDIPHIQGIIPLYHF